jgi:hypothetical protein
MFVLSVIHNSCVDYYQYEADFNDMIYKQYKILYSKIT